MTHFISPSFFLDNLKRAAKREKKLASKKELHSFYLDEVARLARFQNWESFNKKVQSGNFPELEALRLQINHRIATALPNAAQDYITADLRGYLDSNFERLEEYSVPNPASANGYSHPTADIASELETAFEKTYPRNLLQESIKTLNQERKWCSGDDDVWFE